ncbi:hypothetical protein [Chondromyces crocatus]|uniref:BP74 N-terminal domain-containing protein n=1 Tax=Chondromyces crocatus TaxID=52 RepID=A0A0K1EJD1_CHOCO|nr:hypothetical protein [Chondromyces crocatus]AKT40782.1 uncharacterized protein CMC5_049380 [Chondromyces crocatus]
MKTSSTIALALLLGLFSAACEDDRSNTTGTGTTSDPTSSNGAGGAGASGGAGGAGGTGGDGTACDTLPTDGLYATFVITGEQTYHASITNPDGVQEALALWAGEATASIPIGNLVCEPAPWNCGWSWHQDPATVRLAEMTIELCDGTPRLVEAGCADFGGGQFCPWLAELTQLRDCRTDTACPLVPR